MVISEPEKIVVLIFISINTYGVVDPATEDSIAEYGGSIITGMVLLLSF